MCDRYAKFLANFNIFMLTQVILCFHKQKVVVIHCLFKKWLLLSTDLRLTKTYPTTFSPTGGLIAHTRKKDSQRLRILGKSPEVTNGRVECTHQTQFIPKPPNEAE